MADTTEHDIVVESDAIRAVFTTRGAVLKSWRLKRYQDQTGQPLDLVPQVLPPGTARPFTLSPRRIFIKPRPSHALASAESTAIARLNATGEVPAPSDVSETLEAGARVPKLSLQVPGLLVL